jgi:hypothetical protein
LTVKVGTSFKSVTRCIQVLHLLQATVQSIILRHELIMAADLPYPPTLYDSYAISVPNRRQPISI